MSDIFEKINEISLIELERAGFLKKARKNGWVCPACGNGDGRDGTGMSPIPNKHRLKCFKCGETFSATDLIAQHFGFRQNAMSEVAAKAQELFNVAGIPKQSDSGTQATAQATAQATEKIESETPKKDYSEFYQLAQNKLAEFIERQGGQFRGLTLEDLRAVRAGAATATDLKTVDEKVPARAECLILPYDNHRFFMRQVNEVAEGTEPVKRGNKGGKKSKIYNPFTVDFEKSFFVTEGEIDCLSIYKAGFQAVAVSGVTNYNLLIHELKNRKIQTARPIILFDNDAAGRLNAEKAVEELRLNGYTAFSALLSETDKIDSNDFLQKNFDGFRERLTEIYRQANREFAKIEGIEVLADVFDDLDEMSEKLNGNLLKWGFPTLDEKLPMLPGCYLLGALPSLGKTTFALNVAANVCEQGAKVLYISYEPTSKQIAVKDLAGYWFKKFWYNHKNNRPTDFVPTATQIMLGRYNSIFSFDEMKKIREELKEKRKNFYFLQGRRETARDLINKIKSYIDKGIKFVVIDYIQLIKGTDTTKTAREQIDETIRELQIFQSENDLVILFISSFNRENYRSYVCLESFKESGGLEFTADAILSLQLKYSDRESRTDNKLFQKKKQSQPRDMELVGLKNRFGIDFVDEFAYHSAHETFIEKIPAKNTKFENNEVDED